MYVYCHIWVLYKLIQMRTQQSSGVTRIRTHDLLFCFMYTASVIFDYYCRDSELSYIGGIGFQSTPPLEGAGVFNVPEGDFSQNTETPFIKGLHMMSFPVSNTSCHHDRRSTTIRTVCFVKKLRRFSVVLSH